MGSSTGASSCMKMSSARACLSALAGLDCCGSVFRFRGPSGDFWAPPRLSRSFGAEFFASGSAPLAARDLRGKAEVLAGVG